MHKRFQGAPAPPKAPSGSSDAFGYCEIGACLSRLARLLLFKRASEKTKKLKGKVDRAHALKHFGHGHPPLFVSLLVLGACRGALSTLVEG